MAKFFLPGSAWAWYVLEGSPITAQDGTATDWELYGYTVNDYGREIGYFLLSELEGVEAPRAVVDESGAVLGRIVSRVELDAHFTNKTAADIPEDRA